MKAKLGQSIIGVLLLAGFVAPVNSYGQNQKDCAGKYLENLPANLKLEEKKPQKYLLTSVSCDYDLVGNFIKKSRISGEYTRALENGNAKWNNVRISESKDFSEPFSEGEKQGVMENFTYKPLISKDMFKSDSIFKKIPEPSINYRNLIWSMMEFEVYAWTFFDSLKLNKEFVPKIKEHVVQYSGVGTIDVTDFRLIWVGITNMNNKICAIVKFNAMNMPLNVDYLQTKVKGRCHNWGNVYISLVDKQIEYGESYGDVIMDIKLNGQETSFKLNTNGLTTLKKI